MKLATITPKAHPELRFPAPLLYYLATIHCDAGRAKTHAYAGSGEARRVMLDNGAYEGEPLPVIEYIALARSLKPRFLLLPDRVGDPEATLQAHGIACSLILGDLEPFKDTKILAVPQADLSGTPRQATDSAFDFLHEFGFLEMVDGLALSWRGLGQEGTCARARFVERLSHGAPRPSYIHLLGLENDPDELRMLALTCHRHGIMPDSLDTSTPIRQACALNGGALGYLPNGLYPGSYVDYPLSRERYFELKLADGDNIAAGIRRAARTNIRRAKRYLSELFT